MRNQEPKKPVKRRVMRSDWGGVEGGKENEVGDIVFFTHIHDELKGEIVEDLGEDPAAGGTHWFKIRVISGGKNGRHLKGEIIDRVNEGAIHGHA